MAAVARATNVVPYPERRAFEVYPGQGADQAHVVLAASPRDAALAFLEFWHPALEGGDDVEITIIERDSGRTELLVLDLQ